jgi:hypothetical protein
MVELVRGFFKEQKQNLAWIGQIFLIGCKTCSKSSEEHMEINGAVSKLA